MTRSTTLTLPWPPSVGHYWRTVRRGNRVQWILTDRGEAFRTHVICIVGPRDRLRLTERAVVDIMAFPPDRIRRDLDNLLKGILDALTHAAVLADDFAVDDLRIRRGPVSRPHGFLSVHVAQIEAPAALATGAPSAPLPGSTAASP